MKVLLLGSGGREYIFCHQLAKSPHQPKLFIAPGNAGTSQFGTNLELSITDFKGIKQAVLAYHIEMVIVGPEAPLVEGIVDFFAFDSNSEISALSNSLLGFSLNAFLYSSASSSLDLYPSFRESFVGYAQRREGIGKRDGSRKCISH